MRTGQGIKCPQVYLFMRFTQIIMDRWLAYNDCQYGGRHVYALKNPTHFRARAKICAKRISVLSVEFLRLIPPPLVRGVFQTRAGINLRTLLILAAQRKILTI